MILMNKIYTRSLIYVKNYLQSSCMRGAQGHIFLSLTSVGFGREKIALTKGQ